MDWSISKVKLFQSCQRRWYFTTIARWNAKKEPIKRKAFLLKSLQTIQGWRGSLVDMIIEKKILLPIMFGNPVPSEGYVISYALPLADRQIDFGTKKRYLEPGMTKTKAGEEFAAFYDVEYNGGLDPEKIEYAKQEIKTAIQNFYKSPILSELTKPDTKLIIQRDLKFAYNGFNVTAKPDLIIFSGNNPPHIVDWKVHDGRFTDYWQQLTVYAYVLNKVARLKPHKDFPQTFIADMPNPQTYPITEFQLLRGISKSYTISQEDIEHVEDLIHITGEWMQEYYEELDTLSPKDFQTTSFPGSCVTCGFKKLCQEVDSNDTE